MSAHLLAITIGPVQDFIAAARRTRDLWFGSFLLSEISKAAAKAVKDAGGDLIFPYSDDLNRDLGLATEDHATDTFNVVNVILAEVADQLNPKEIASRARTGAEERWEYWASRAFLMASSIIEAPVWKSQVRDVIEFYAAWTPMTPKYGASRQRVMRLLAGRKALRDFVPGEGLAQVPKSSLDGLRESVLVRGDSRAATRKLRHEKLGTNDRLAHRLRLRVGEELDAVALTKRAATKEVFASVVRVAVDPWVRGIEADGDAALGILRDEIGGLCAELVGHNPEDSERITGTGWHYRDTVFRYDGSVLLPNRLDAMIREAQAPETQRLEGSEEEPVLFGSDDARIFEKIEAELRTLIMDLRYGEPEPYLAVLVADGDRMGKLLTEIAQRGGVQEHRMLTKQQSDFAGQVRDIVSNHQGCTVFAGGDDVLAFVPVDRCLACAESLHDVYGRTLSLFNYPENGEAVAPTLSIGIAIGHSLEPLEDLLQFARDAEKAAKGKDLPKEAQGDGLAVHVHTRGGPPVRVRESWRGGLRERLDGWIQCHLTGALSDKAAYDLHRVAQAYEGWEDQRLARAAIAATAKRLIARKAIKEDKRPDIGRYLERLETEEPGALTHEARDVVQNLASEWLVARRMARSYRQGLGQKGFAALLVPQTESATI